MTDLFQEPETKNDSNAPELTVSELSNRLKRTVEDAYSFVRVRGELGRVTIAKSGHLYADLKDDKSVLNMIMWKGQTQRLQFRPEEGLEVVAEGRLSTYAGRSAYQLLADTIRPAGAGALMQLLEERKKKLAAEGLFREEHKKPLPYLPRVIGVVTSPTGAVIRDILHRVNERFPTNVLVWPVLVQGEYAAEQVSQGVRGFNAIPAEGGNLNLPRPDLIIVARGGGSVEDLWPFNDEAVVRAVFESEIPVISAVGHETDTTLIDYVSDRRAPTPTGAAEIALPVRAEILERVTLLDVRSSRALRRCLSQSGMHLRAVAAKLPRPESLVQAPRQRLDYVAEKLVLTLRASIQRRRMRMDRAASRLQPISLKRELVSRRTQLTTLGMRSGIALRRNISDRAQRLASFHARLRAQDPRQSLSKREDVLNKLVMRMAMAKQRIITRKREKLETTARLLDSVSHESVLARGFVLVQRMSGELVRTSTDVDPGERLCLQFVDDEVRVTADGHKPTERPRIISRHSTKKGEQGDLF